MWRWKLAFEVCIWRSGGSAGTGCVSHSVSRAAVTAPRSLPGVAGDRGAGAVPAALRSCAGRPPDSRGPRAAGLGSASAAVPGRCGVWKVTDQRFLA